MASNSMPPTVRLVYNFLNIELRLKIRLNKVFL